jgi:hypothetical protein
VKKIDIEEQKPKKKSDPLVDSLKLGQSLFSWEKLKRMLLPFAPPTFTLVFRCLLKTK